MTRTALAAAAAATVAISTVGAENLPPPMDIMGPYDTPAAAVDRITLPGDAGALGAQHAEAGVENAGASPPQDAGLLDVPAGLGGTDALDMAMSDRDDGDDRPDKPDKPEKPDKPDKPEKPDDDNDG